MRKNRGIYTLEVLMRLIIQIGRGGCCYKTLGCLKRRFFGGEGVAGNEKVQGVTMGVMATVKMKDLGDEVRDL